MTTVTNYDSILKWTGHPLIDAGTAALVAFAKKRCVSEVTASDLQEFAEFAERNYLSGDLSKTVGVLFTTNNFLNPSIKTPAEKQARIRAAVSGFVQPGDESRPPCVFCGRLSLRTLHRDDVPMILGRTIVNFYPGGVPGLAICGACQLALHGLTVGAPRCSGKALVLFADDPEFQVALVREWVNRARRHASLNAQGETGTGLSAPRTRVIEALSRAQLELRREERSVGLVAYHLSNSGQGPGIEVYPLPSTVVQFVQRASAQRYREAWSTIERRAWQRLGKKGGSAADLSEEERGEYRNYLYEDLFRLPQEAGRFIRIYFLRSAARLVRRSDTDPRADYRTESELDAINWELVELFLKEVLGMDQARVTAIRELGDRLALEVAENNDRRLMRTAYTARRYDTIRRLLIQANHRALTGSAGPVLGLDDFLLVFEEGEELARSDWRLAWDLVLIRLIEQLHQRGKTEIVKDAVTTEEIAATDEVDARQSA